jgi:hypothetical protein
MTQRQRKIAQQILEVLNMMDGAQVNETILHAEINLRVKPNATFSEFSDALNVCDSNGWAVGVQPRFGGARLWSLSDAGQAARLQMQKS